MTLNEIRNYKKQIFSEMSVAEAEQHSDFIEAIYATESFLLGHAIWARYLGEAICGSQTSSYEK